MKSLLKSKILLIDDLKTRTSKPSNYELESSSIKKISKMFGQSLEAGLSCLVETAREVSSGEFAGLQLLSIEKKIISGKGSEKDSEAILIPFSLSESDAGSFWVGKNTAEKFDFEDLRILQSLGEIASDCIQTHLIIKLERDNLERVFNSTPSASAVWRGDDLVFDRVNDAYQSLFPDLELEGKPFEEALPPRIVRDYPELFRNVLKTGKPFSIEEQYTPVQHYAGGPLEDHYYNVNFVQLKNRDGSPYGIYQHTVDITTQVEARKKLEAETNKLEAIFNDSPAALAMFKGREALFEKINHLWIELVSPREYIGKTYREVYPEFLKSGLIEKYEIVFDTGEPYRGKEMPLDIEVSPGIIETHYFDFSYVRVLDGEGKPYGVFCHCTNVTENRKFNELLRSALHSRDVFMTIASHELNTPITSLKLQTQLRQRILLKNGNEVFTNEQNLKFLNQTLAQVDRLSLLVSDMLDIGRINSGHFRMNKVVTSFTKILKDVVEHFEPHFESVGSKLFSELQDDVILTMDPLRIEQVITNLLTNALKYAANSNVTISLRAFDGFAFVSVKDKGQGISLENKSRIFERFERATSEMHISGMGLGLYISRQIISAHDGTIDVESEVGKGSEFYFKIPIHL